MKALGFCIIFLISFIITGCGGGEDGSEQTIKSRYIYEQTLVNGSTKYNIILNEIDLSDVETHYSLEVIKSESGTCWKTIVPIPVTDSDNIFVIKDKHSHVSFYMDFKQTKWSYKVGCREEKDPVSVEPSDIEKFVLNPNHNYALTNEVAPDATPMELFFAHGGRSYYEETSDQIGNIYPTIDVMDKEVMGIKVNFNKYTLKKGDFSLEKFGFGEELVGVTAPWEMEFHLQHINELMFLGCVIDDRFSTPDLKKLNVAEIFGLAVDLVLNQSEMISEFKNRGFKKCVDLIKKYQ